MKWIRSIFQAKGQEVKLLFFVDSTEDLQLDKMDIYYSYLVDDEDYGYLYQNLEFFECIWRTCRGDGKIRTEIIKFIDKTITITTDHETGKVTRVIFSMCY